MPQKQSKIQTSESKIQSSAESSPQLSIKSGKILMPSYKQVMNNQVKTRTSRFSNSYRNYDKMTSRILRFNSQGISSSLIACYGFYVCYRRDVMLSKSKYKVLGKTQCW